MNHIIRTITLSAVLAAGSAWAASGELQASARNLIDALQDSVVWVSIIAKSTVGVEGDAPPQVKAGLSAMDKEGKSEATGTIIDPSGLIVTSLASIDKSSMVDGKVVNVPGVGPIKLKSTSEIKEIKVIMPDGTEIPADLVLKDADLGLGFIRVRADSKEAKGVTFKAIDLKDSAKGSLLDDCIGLGRLDDNMNREPSVVTTEISGLTTKPRLFYRVLTDSIGCPVFLSSGKLLGITTVRKPGSDDGGTEVRVSPVVLPAADMVKLADQAKAAPVPAAADSEKKDEDKKSDEKKDESK